MRALATTIGALAVACGPTVASDDGGTGSGSGTTQAAESGPVTTVTSGGEVGDESSTSSTSTSSTSGADSSGSTGDASVCDPQPEEMIAGLLRLDAEDLRSEHLTVDADCTIDDVIQLDAITQRWVLACDQPHTVDIYDAPAVLLPPTIGRGIHLRADRSSSPEWEHVAITDDAGLVVGMLGSLALPDEVDVPAWFAPFEVEYDDTVCEPEPFVPPDPIDPCPAQIQRAAFMVISPWAMGFVYDQTGAPFGAYEVRVFASTAIPQGGEPECPAGPLRSGRIAFFRNR